MQLVADVAINCGSIKIYFGCVPGSGASNIAILRVARIIMFDRMTNSKGGHEMRTLHIAIWGAIATLACTSYADTLSDQLKVADCNYRILRKGEPINVVKQIITLRATAEKGEVNLSEPTQPELTGAYGTGYRSYYIEFSFMDTRIDFSDVDNIEFYAGETLVYVSDIRNQSRQMVESDERTEQKKRYFSINLQGIPLLMLDDITTINIIL